MPACLLDWLVCWLVDWMAGWLVGWLVLAWLDFFFFFFFWWPFYWKPTRCLEQQNTFVDYVSLFD